jgi:hypothetical protein
VFTLKKLLLTLSAVFLISINAMAFNIYIEGFGTYVGNAQAENQFGGGGGLFFGINKNFSIGLKGSATSLITYDAEKFAYTFSDTMFLGGLEYNFQIAGLPLFWSSFLGFGFEMIYVNIPYKEYLPGPPWIVNRNMTYNDMGFSVGITTGIRWDFHSHIALFANVGFHMPFFNNPNIPNPSNNYMSGGLKGWSIYGLIAQVGVRFAFWNNKPIDEQY